MSSPSAYPIADDVLAEKVRVMAAELGVAPSRNKVMKTFRVGADKAKAALAELAQSTPEPTGLTGSESAAEVGPRPGLHVVRFQAPPPVRGDSGRPEVHQEEIGNPGSTEEPAEFEPTETEGASVEVTPVAEPVAEPSPSVPRWPALLIALPAFIAVWSGWTGLGELTGFGPVALLPGIADEFIVNTAITLPIGVEAYAAYAMWVWLGPGADRLAPKARRFACGSAIGSLVLGAGGQVAYHLMAAAGMQQAPWQITAFVSCLPVVVIGCAGALIHLAHRKES